MLTPMLTATLLLLAPADDAEPAEALDALSWLNGCWQGEGLGGAVSECWMRAESGELIGAFQYSRDGVLQFSEMLMIGEAGGRFGYHVKHFNRDFTGWEASDEQVSFDFLAAEASGADFSGLQIERDGEDRFVLRLQMGTSDSAPRTAEFVYWRAE